MQRVVLWMGVTTKRMREKGEKGERSLGGAPTLSKPLGRELLELLAAARGMESATRQGKERGTYSGASWRAVMNA